MQKHHFNSIDPRLLSTIPIRNITTVYLLWLQTNILRFLLHLRHILPSNIVLHSLKNLLEIVVLLLLGPVDMIKVLVRIRYMVSLCFRRIWNPSSFKEIFNSLKWPFFSRRFQRVFHSPREKNQNFRIFFLSIRKIFAVCL